MISNIEQTGGGKPAGKTDGDFKNLVDLLAIYSEAENRLEELQAEANQEYLQVVDSKKAEYAKLQATLMETGKAVEILVRRHPEWLLEKKTVKTPYGSTSLKDNPPKIVADNPELSIVLIERDGEIIPKTINTEPNPDAVDASKLIHQEKTLNLEALGGCTDAQLKRWRLRREQTDTFTVKSAKLDMGKAVKEAAESKVQSPKSKV